MTKGTHKGFTLIELMVVIAIIGVLSAIITANFTAAKSKARDTQRVSNLSQIQFALASYFNACNSYPPDITASLASTCAQSVNNISMSTYISKIPSPPNASENYYYVVDAAADDYFLVATLENAGAASNNALSAPPAWYSTSYSPAYTGTGSVLPGSAAGGVPTTLTCVATGKNYCVGPR